MMELIWLLEFGAQIYFVVKLLEYTPVKFRLLPSPDAIPANHI